MNENQQLLNRSEDSIVLTDQVNDYAGGTNTTNELAKVAIGALIGATLGAVAAALTIKGTAQKVNQTVKGVGNAVKGATGSFNQTLKGVGDAIKTLNLQLWTLTTL